MNGRVVAAVLLAVAVGAGCGADEDPVPLADPPSASDPEVPLRLGCFTSVDHPGEPPSRDRLLVDATIVGAESAPPGLTYGPPDGGWSEDGPRIPCIADAWTTAFYGGADHRALVDVSLAADAATARRAIADAPALLGFSHRSEVERPANGPGDERVTISGDGADAVLWRRERFVALVLVQSADEPPATSASETALRASALLSAAQDARIVEALAAP